MTKREAIKQRAIKHGMLFIKRGATIRSVEKETGCSRSAIHLDLHRLEEYHPELFEKVKKKLQFNWDVKHLRGGETTRKKYERKKKNDSK